MSDDRRDIIDALMVHAQDFADLHHGRIRMDANAAGLVADIVLGYMHEVTEERDHLKTRVAALRRAFVACNQDRRFAWHEAHHDNAVAVAAEREKVRLLDENASLRKGIEMERRINTENGCPDCGVHAGCAEVAAERDRLRDAVGDLEAQVSMLDVRTAERDRLRAVAVGARAACNTFGDWWMSDERNESDTNKLSRAMNQLLRALDFTEGT